MPTLKQLSEELNEYFLTSKIKLKRRCETITDIANTHGEKYLIEFYKEYYTTNDVRRKLFLRYGNERVNEYDHRLKARKKARPNSRFSQSYWIKKGQSKETAIKTISELQRANALTRTANSYKNQSGKVKYSIDYWTAQGYTQEEAEILRRPYLQPMLQNKEAFIERYGKVKGEKRYREKTKKWKESMDANRDNHKSAGYVSRESLKFFIPLYRACRRIGIERKKIYLGVDGSRELFIRHPGHENRGRFFDFSIPSLGIVIEYNGSFWHPRSRDEWRNPWIDFDDAILIEEEKKALCKMRGYTLLTVWDTDDKMVIKNQILKLITDRQNELLWRNGF